MDTQRIKHVLSQIADPSNGGWVAQARGIAIAAASSFIMPVKAYLYVIGALVLADMYTGWRASKKATGAKFNSKGMGGTIEKTVLYLIAILVCHGVDTAFGLSGTFSVTYLVAGLVTGRELLSNLENIGKVTGLDLAQRVRDAFGHLFGRKDA